MRTINIAIASPQPPPHNGAEHSASSPIQPNGRNTVHPGHDDDLTLTGLHRRIEAIHDRARAAHRSLENLHDAIIAHEEMIQKVHGRLGELLNIAAELKNGNR